MSCGSVQFACSKPPRANSRVALALRSSAVHQVNDNFSLPSELRNEQVRRSAPPLELQLEVDSPNGTLTDSPSVARALSVLLESRAKRLSALQSSAALALGRTKSEHKTILDSPSSSPESHKSLRARRFIGRHSQLSTSSSRLCRSSDANRQQSRPTKPFVASADLS